MFVDDRAVPLGGAGIRSVLAMLLLEPNQVVSLDRIVDVLWAHEPPASARTMVQGYVSRLRQRIAEAGVGGAHILTTPPGYRMVVDESMIDVTGDRRHAGRNCSTRRTPCGVARHSPTSAAGCPRRS